MLKNIVANLIGRLWGTLSNFLFIPLYIHYLGFESYSIISFTLVLAGLMAVLDSGITATLSREFSRQDKCESEKIILFKTLESLYFGIVLFLIVFMYLSSDTIAVNFVNAKDFNSVEIAYLLKIISIDIGFQLLFRFYMGGMFGLEQQIRANIYQVAWGMLRNGLVVISFYFSRSLEVFFIWQAVSSVVFSLVARTFLYKLLDIKNLDFKLAFDAKVFASVWRFAFGMFLISCVAAINSQLDKLVISVMLPVETLGYYTLCVSLGLGLVMLVSPFSTALLPRLTALYTTGQQSTASTLFVKLVVLVSIIIFSFMSNMIFNSQKIIWIWTGDIDLAEKASIYLPIILFSYAMLGLAVLPFTLAVANGYTKINNILGILSLFVTLPGYWFGSKYYGAFGASVVYFFTQTIMTFTYFYLISRKYIYQVSILKIYLFKIISPCCLALLFAFLISLLPEWWEQSRLISLIQLLVEILLCFIFLLLLFMPSILFRYITKLLSKSINLLR